MKFKRITSIIIAAVLSITAALAASAVTNETSEEFITDGVDFHQLEINEVFPDINPEDIKVITFSFSADLSETETAKGQIAANSPAMGWVEADVSLTLLGGSMTTSLDVSFSADDEWYNCSVATWGFESGVVIDLLNASGQSLINDVIESEPEESDIAEDDIEDDTVNENDEAEAGDTNEETGFVKGAENDEQSESPVTSAEILTSFMISLTALGAAGIAGKIKQYKK